MSKNVELRKKRVVEIAKMFGALIADDEHVELWTRLSNIFMGFEEFDEGEFMTACGIKPGRVEVTWKVVKVFEDHDVSVCYDDADRLEREIMERYECNTVSRESEKKL
jgi:hypothetical protein